MNFRSRATAIVWNDRLRIKCQEQLEHLKQQIVNESGNCGVAIFSYMHSIH